MKKMQKVLALLLAVVFLASCGQTSKTTEEPKKEETKKEEVKQEEPKKEEEKAPAEQGKKLVYWSMWEATEPQGQVIQEAINAFTAETGIEVDAQFKGRTGIREGLQPALDSNVQIDLFDEDIDRVNKTWGKYLYDLTALVEESGYDKTGFVATLEAAKKQGDGKFMSLPYQPFIFNMFYNKDLFEQAGVKELPKTWAEFLAVCETLKNAGVVPMTFDDAYATALFGYHLARYIDQPGVEDVVTNGKWAETPEVLAAAKDFENMAKMGYFSPQVAGNVWPAGQNTELALGTAAMYLNGSWLPNEVKDITGPDFKWGCFSYPAVEGGKADTSYANYGAQVFAVNKNSTMVKEAFQLIQKITRGEFDKKLADASMGIPSDASNKDWPAQLAEVKPVLEQTANRWDWAANIGKNADMEPAIKENFIKLAGGSITAEEFVKTLEEASSK